MIGACEMQSTRRAGYNDNPFLGVGRQVCVTFHLCACCDREGQRDSRRCGYSTPFSIEPIPKSLRAIGLLIVLLTPSTHMRLENPSLHAGDCQSRKLYVKLMKAM